MDYMKGLQYILSHRDGVKGTSLDIMCGHVKPTISRINDIQFSVEIVEFNNEEYI